MLPFKATLWHVAGADPESLESEDHDLNSGKGGWEAENGI